MYSKDFLQTAQSMSFHKRYLNNTKTGVLFQTPKKKKRDQYQYQYFAVSSLSLSYLESGTCSIFRQPRSRPNAATLSEQSPKAAITQDGRGERRKANTGGSCDSRGTVTPSGTADKPNGVHRCVGGAAV